MQVKEKMSDFSASKRNIALVSLLGTFEIYSSRDLFTGMLFR
jgi:hypothetical protein